MEKELGHPILAFTMARVLPGADCPLTVGLCEGPLHSPSDYAASLRQRQGKEPGRMWADALRVGGGGGLLFHDTHHSSGRGLDQHSGGACCHGDGQILPETAASGQEEEKSPRPVPLARRPTHPFCRCATCERGGPAEELCTADAPGDDETAPPHPPPPQPVVGE